MYFWMFSSIPGFSLLIQVALRNISMKYITMRNISTRCQISPDGGGKGRHLPLSQLRNSELKNGLCFKPLCFEVVCYIEKTANAVPLFLALLP